MTREFRLPPERFYWALLDGSKLVGSKYKRNESLSYLFEAQIPESLESVHAVFADAGQRRFVACGIRKQILASETPPDCVTVTPESIPAFLGVSLDPAGLNLLTAEFTPSPVRQARRRILVEAAITWALVAILLVVGLERRRLAYESLGETAASDTLQLYATKLGYKPGGTLPPSLQLQAELRTLQRTRSDSESPNVTKDAALSLATLLAKWPATARAEIDGVQVTSNAIHVQSEVPTNDDAQNLASSLASLDGWRAEIPTVQGREGGVRFNLQWNAIAKESSR